MFNSPILDVAIGMIFVYLLLSLLATAAQEVIASQTRDRGKLLRQSISTLLYDDILGYTLSSRFYSHPIIKKFNIDREAPLPSYISDETFVKVLKDILPTSDAEGNLVIQSNASETVKERLELLPNSELKIMLLNFLGNRKDSERPATSAAFRRTGAAAAAAKRSFALSTPETMQTITLLRETDCSARPRFP